MKRLYYLTVLPCLIGIMGCSGKSSFVPESNQVVVQGYLYAGKPVRDIRLTSTLGLGSLDTDAPPINDAVVRLIKNGDCYQLRPPYRFSDGYYSFSNRIISPGDCPGGECPGDELTVEEGDFFILEVLHYDKVATAETVVPPPPADIGVFPDSLSVSESSYPGTGEFSSGGPFIDDPNIAVTVSWQDDGSSMYYVILESKDTYSSPIDPDYPFGSPAIFVSSPVAGDRFPIGWINITHYGRYLVTVYRLNQEYADMYLTRNQDTRDLNEPLTNVENGLGIFTALNSSEIFFYVKPE